MKRGAVVTAPGGLETSLDAEELRVRLVSLLGVPGAPAAEEPEARGIFALATSAGSGDLARPVLLGLSEGGDTIAATFEAAGGSLKIDSVWTLDAANLVVSRRDTVKNAGTKPVSLRRCQARFVLQAGVPRLHVQRGKWGRESQGEWMDPPPSELVLSGHQGRTAVPSTPYLFLVPEETGPGLAFHVMPRGNWTIRVARRAGYYDGRYVTVVEAGLSDQSLDLVLEPGRSLELPEIVVQAVPEREPWCGAAPLHRHAWKEWFSKARAEFPVQYNTWFDRYDDLDLAHLREELAAAKEAGCEVFTIDAGWFGHAEGSWDGRVGDWRETQDRSFKGRMRDFADEVRAAGLKFGLWMEAERVVRTTPVAKKHPELLAPAGHRAFRVMLEDPAGHEYLKAEMSRVIGTYGLAWIKIDSNFPLGLDERSTELSDYYEAWFRLLGELKKAFPECVFEACSSGGLRLDLNLVRHHECGFLSDNVTPNDMVRMIQGTALRIPPARLTLWTVIKHRPDLGVVAARIHGWDDPVPVDIDFVALVCMPGIFVLSGDLAALPAAERARLASRVAWYKKWRGFIAAASTELLTPPAPMEDHSGWAALQLGREGDPRSLVFAYRLDDPWAVNRFPLRGLDPGKRYAVRRDGKPEAEATGAELMDRGVRVELPARFRAAVYELEPLP